MHPMATAKKTPPPTFTTVLLVRHGQTPTTGKVLPGRAKGLHLADEGRRQAEIAAQRISELKRVDAIYSSPLERAKETAALNRCCKCNTTAKTQARTSVFYLKEKLQWNHLVGFILIIAAVYVIFKKW